jgi:hypothetical protein
MGTPTLLRERPAAPPHAHNFTAGSRSDHTSTHGAPHFVPGGPIRFRNRPPLLSPPTKPAPAGSVDSAKGHLAKRQFAAASVRAISALASDIVIVTCFAGMATSLFVDWFKGYASQLSRRPRSDRSSTYLERGTEAPPGSPPRLQEGRWSGFGAQAVMSRKTVSDSWARQRAWNT